jgi:hypothetical protein
LVQSHNLAIDDGVVRELRESVCYGRKPGRKIIPVAGHEPNSASAPDSKRAVPVEFDLVFPIRSFRQLGNGQALHRLDEAGRVFGRPFLVRLNHDGISDGAATTLSPIDE